MKPTLRLTLDGLVRALRREAHAITVDLDLSRGLMEARPDRGDDRSARTRTQRARRRDDDSGRD
jgi:hypothetical protein